MGAINQMEVQCQGISIHRNSDKGRSHCLLVQCQCAVAERRITHEKNQEKCPSKEHLANQQYTNRDETEWKSCGEKRGMMASGTKEQIREGGRRWSGRAPGEESFHQAIMAAIWRLEQIGCETYLQYCVLANAMIVMWVEADDHKIR